MSWMSDLFTPGGGMGGTQLGNQANEQSNTANQLAQAGELEKFKPKVNAYFQANFGRPATQGEIDSWAKSMQVYGEDILDQTMRSNPEVAKHFQDVETKKTQDAYNSRAPIRANMYSELAGNVNQATQQGNTALYHNLAQRGLMDSGSMARGTTNLGINAQNAMQKGATAIQNEDYGQALQSGQNLTNFNNQLYSQQQGFNQQNNLANQQYAYLEANKPKQPDWWESLLGAGAQGVGAGAGKYFASMLF